MPAVAAPAKGASTVQRPPGSSCSQVDSQPTVCRLTSTRQEPYPVDCRALPELSLSASVQLPLSSSLPSSSRRESTIRLQGAPQTRHAAGEVPARTHGSTRASGKVAKWAPLKHCVGTVQTLRRLRPAPPTHSKSWPRAASLPP